MAFAFAVFEDLFDHRRVLNTGDDFDGAATCLTGLDVNPEHAFEASRPCPGLVFFGFRSVVPGGTSFTSARWGNLLANMAVRRENTMKPCEVDPRSGYQRGQSCDEIQWLEDNVGRAVSPGCLERVANLALAGPRQPRTGDGRLALL